MYIVEYAQRLRLSTFRLTWDFWQMQSRCCRNQWLHFNRPSLVKHCLMRLSCLVSCRPESTFRYMYLCIFVPSQWAVTCRAYTFIFRHQTEAHVRAGYKRHTSLGHMQAVLGVQTKNRWEHFARNSSYILLKWFYYPCNQKKKEWNINPRLLCYHISWICK